MQKRKSRAQKKQRRRFFKNRFLNWTAKLAIWFFIVTLSWVVLLKFINPPITWLMLQRGFEQKSEGKKWKLEKKWVPYEDISDNLKRAAIAGEDANFMTHNGFDGEAIREALERNREGGLLRGGSTISQQTAKNVFLWPHRSWIRKGFEVYFTFLIESIWGKKRIMEVYLNVIETGDGLYGAEAATQHYYGKSAVSLTKREAALLVAVLPNPRRWSPAKPTSFINRKSNTIVRYLNHYTIP